jgi:hypothetical protein
MSSFGIGVRLSTVSARLKNRFAHDQQIAEPADTLNEIRNLRAAKHQHGIDAHGAPVSDLCLASGFQASRKGVIFMAVREPSGNPGFYPGASLVGYV